MASTGKRVRAVFAKMVNRDVRSIQDTDELNHYGFNKVNYFSLLENMEGNLGRYGLHFEISDSDIELIANLKTVKDLVDFIGRISREHHKEVKNRG